MDRYVTQLNIEHFQQQIATECDPKKQEMLCRLLAEQQEKLAALSAEPAEPLPPNAASALGED